MHIMHIYTRAKYMRYCNCMRSCNCYAQSFYILSYFIGRFGRRARFLVFPLRPVHTQVIERPAKCLIALRAYYNYIAVQNTELCIHKYIIIYSTWTCRIRILAYGGPQQKDIFRTGTKSGRVLDSYTWWALLCTKLVHLSLDVVKRSRD